MTLKSRLGVTQDQWKWQHSKAWGTVPYSHYAAATMSVYLAISETFSFKK